MRAQYLAEQPFSGDSRVLMLPTRERHTRITEGAKSGYAEQLVEFKSWGLRSKRLGARMKGRRRRRVGRGISLPTVGSARGKALPRFFKFFMWYSV